MSNVWIVGIFSNITLLKYPRYMFRYNNSLYDIETRNHNGKHAFPIRTFGGSNVLRYRIA